MLSMTTRRSLSIPVELTRDEALAAARMALGELAWPLNEDEGLRLIASEDPVRLHCHCQPIQAEIEAVDSGGGQAALLVETSVPGRGPISSKHLHAQTGVLARSILAQIRARKSISG